MRNGDAGQPDRFYVDADRRAVHRPRTSPSSAPTSSALRKRLRAASGVRMHDAFPRVRQGLPPPSGHRVRAGDGAVPPDGLDEVGRQPHRLRPRATCSSRSTRPKADRTSSPTSRTSPGRTRRCSAPRRSSPRSPRCSRTATRHDAVRAEIAALAAQREALRYYFADLKAAAAGANSPRSLDRTGAAERSARQLDESRSDGCASTETSRQVERAGHGGNRLADIERADRRERRRRATAGRATRTVRRRCWPMRAWTRWRPASSSPPGAREITAAPGRRRAGSRRLPERADRAGGASERSCEDEAAEVNAELRSLRERKSNIPKRTWICAPRLCRELRHRRRRAAVRRRADRGARTARPTGRARPSGCCTASRCRCWCPTSTTAPCPTGSTATTWGPGGLLPGARPSRAGGRADPSTGRARWPPSWWSRTPPFAAWLERELARRADHACVETMAEFRRMPRAITKAGQVKGSGGRHEKDDRVASTTAAGTCSAGPTSARSTRCWTGPGRWPAA